MADTKKGFVPTTFNDVGTGQSFEGGKEHVFDAGAFDNYSAAGLIGDTWRYNNVTTGAPSSERRVRVPPFPSGRFDCPAAPLSSARTGSSCAHLLGATPGNGMGGGRVRSAGLDRPLASARQRRVKST